jgi:hypothetical protein
MRYEVVFDVVEVGYRQWKFPACCFVFLAVIGVGQLALRRSRPADGQSASRRWFSRFSLGFGVFCVVVSSVSTFWDYWSLRQALLTGQYEVVEGVVTDFVPMPRMGHARERFVVNGRRFEYSDYLVTAGFNNSSSHGGPIRLGLRVRIANVGGKIARLEIAR